MEIVSELKSTKVEGKSVVTIGTFDGLHEGHQQIFNTLKLKSKELNLKAVVITFFPHPRTVLSRDFGLKLLSPLEEKKKLLKDLGVDYLCVIPFTKDFATKTYQEFFDEYLINKVNAEHLVIGYDHKFGKDRNGDLNSLIEYTKKNNIGLTVVGPKEINSRIVSSTKIRNAISSGEIDTANAMLGRNYFLEGVVIEGAKRGRTLGFPTANLKLEDNNKLVPKNGVYCVRVILENKDVFYGVANIGLRPTFNHAKEPITEVFIFDFNDNIYGQSIKVEFLKRIRDEKKFSSKEELEKRIKIDVDKAKDFIKEINK